MSFIESATLKVIDESTGPINKINAELRKLQQTARSLRNINISFNVNTGPLNRALALMNQLRRPVTIQVRVNQSPAVSALSRLQTMATRSLSQPVQQATTALGKFNAQAKQFSAAQMMQFRANTQAMIAQGGAAIQGQFSAAQVMQYRAANQNLVRQLQASAAAQTRAAAAPWGPRPQPTTSVPSVRPSAAAPAAATAGGGGGVGRGGYQVRGGGFAGGLGMGIGIPAAGFGAAEATGFMIGRVIEKAVKYAYEKGADRDRTLLQSNVQASQAQRDIFKQMGGELPPRTATGLNLTYDERSRLFVSLLGDVQGTADTPEARERERARSAARLTQQLESVMLPRMLSMNPDLAKDQAGRNRLISDMRVNIQAMNLATGQLVDRVGKFTPEGERVYSAIMRARSANPELMPNLIKTTLAGAKTAAYSLNENALVKLFLNAGERGARAGNEAYQAMLAGTGTIDNKGLNNAMAAVGFLTDVKRNKKGNVITGSGKPIDSELLRSDPGEFYYQYMQEPIVKMANEQEKLKAKREGRKARDPFTKWSDFMDGYFDDEENDVNGRIADAVQRIFPNMRQTGKQFIMDAILSHQQIQSAMEQSALAMNQSIDAATRQSWTAMQQNLGNAISDRVSGAFDAVAKATDAAGSMEKASNFIRGDKYARLKQQYRDLTEKGELPVTDLITPSEMNAYRAARGKAKADMALAFKERIRKDLQRQIDEMDAQARTQAERISADIAAKTDKYSIPEYGKIPPEISKLSAPPPKVGKGRKAKAQKAKPIWDNFLKNTNKIIEQFEKNDVMPRYDGTTPSTVARPPGTIDPWTNIPRGQVRSPAMDAKGNIKWETPNWAEIGRQIAIANAETNRVYGTNLPAGGPGAPGQQTQLDTSGLTNAVGTLQTALSGGSDQISGAAQALTSGGQAAGDAIKDGGNQAASAIKAAMSTPITVNVNVAGGTKGGDPGASPAPGGSNNG